MSLGSSERASSGEHGTGDTHRPIFTVTTSPTFHYGTTYVGNNGVGVRSTVLEFGNTLTNVGNNCLGVRDTTMNVRNGYIRIYCKFGLEIES